MNKIDIVQTVILSVTLSLNVIMSIVTIISLRVDNNTKINAAHRELWLQGISSNQINRLFDKNIDLEVAPLTMYETRFTTLVFLHTANTYRALKFKTANRIEGLKNDVLYFMSFPIPKMVWEQIKPMQNKKFISFIEDTINSK